MYARKLLTVAVATIVLVGGAAAVGAAVPADAAAGDASSGDGSAASPGPDDGLPGQVPDRVSGIHDAISSFLHGGVDNLGSALGNLLGSADDAGDARSDRTLNDDY